MDPTQKPPEPEEPTEAPVDPFFRVDQLFLIKGVLFRVRKITNKDLILRPVKNPAAKMPRLPGNPSAPVDGQPKTEEKKSE